MKIKNIYKLYFSAGGTGKKVLDGIVSGIPEGENVIDLDLTIQKNRKMLKDFGENDLVLFSVMTMSNVFGPEDLFQNIKAYNTPLVCVAMCGNQYTGVALPRMKKDLEKLGFKVVSAGSFIGKHSCEKGICDSRPDYKDMSIAKKLGQDTWSKLCDWDGIGLDKIKADRPKVKSLTNVWSNIKISLINMKPTTVNPLIKKWCQFEADHKCIGCGKCAKRCPMSAIEIHNNRPKHIQERCIGCFRCVNICSTGAMQNTSKVLHTFGKEVNAYTNRKEPIIYI